MKTLSHLTLVLLFAVATTFLQAKEAPTTPHYIDPASVDLKAILPDPPADQSPETQKELALILEKQKSRTPDELKRAQSEAKLTVFAFADVLGPWFSADKLPVTVTFFQNVDDDSHLVSESAKKFWGRPRPSVLDKEIVPAIELPKSAAYPSGHATRGELFALVLAEIFPEQKEAILARGRQIGDDRVIAGVHYPTDVTAGQKLADTLMPKFDASAPFKADLAKARAELTAAKAKP